MWSYWMTLLLAFPNRKRGHLKDSAKPHGCFISPKSGFPKNSAEKCEARNVKFIPEHLKSLFWAIKQSSSFFFRKQH